MALTELQASVYDRIVSQLRNWGLVTDDDDSFAQLIWSLTKQDKSGDYMIQEIRASEAYRRRFPVLAEINRKYNLGWDEAKYISQEQSYIEALSVLGPAADRYKSRDTYAQWMLNDVAPIEVQRRVDDAMAYVYSDAPASVRDALRTQYGLSDQDLIAYMLDPEKVGKELEVEFAQRQSRANIMGAAADANVTGISADTINAAANSRYGQTYADASLVFSNVAAEGESWRRLAEASGESSLTSDDLAAAGFGTAKAGDVERKKKRLASQERARFSGSSGIGARSLQTGGLGSQ